VERGAPCVLRISYCVVRIAWCVLRRVREATSGTVKRLVQLMLPHLAMLEVMANMAESTLMRRKATPAAMTMIITGSIMLVMTRI